MAYRSSRLLMGHGDRGRTGRSIATEFTRGRNTFIFWTTFDRDVLLVLVGQLVRLDGRATISSSRISAI